LERALQRRGRRIIDRTDQAGDIARRGRLAPPFGQRPARLALEIDDEDIVLDDQHLSEMEIAVVPDVQAVDILRKQRAQSIMQGGALCQHLIDQQTIASFSVSRFCFRCRKQCSARATTSSIQSRTCSGRVGSGVKSANSLLPASARCISATRLPVCDI